MFSWQKSLEFGIDIIDKQHKGIFEEVNKLVASFEDGKEQEQAYEMLCFIEEYIKRHFSSEEFYLAKYDCPGAEEHAQMHRDFSAKIMKLKTDYQMLGITKSAAIEISNILIKWCKTHIMLEDRKYVPYVLAGMGKD